MRARPILAALVFAPAAAGAAEWETRISGFYNLGVGYADPAGGDEDFAVFRDGEVHFRGKLVADNGLVFETRVELENVTARDQIDENWGSISGPFGTLLIGGADSALNEHGGVGVVSATARYFNYYDADISILPGDPGGFVGEDDSLGMRYWYARGGFEAGVSYQPSVGVDNAADSNNPVFEANDQFAFGASYERAFENGRLALGGGYLANDALEIWHVGIEAGYAGFEAAIFYDRVDPDGASPNDLSRIGVGATYRTGPWIFGGGYTHTDGMNGTGNQDFVSVGGSYDLAPGVSLRAAAQWGEDEVGTDGAGGFAWINLRF